jgi:hypothetical protein
MKKHFTILALWRYHVTTAHLTGLPADTGARYNRIEGILMQTTYWWFLLGTPVFSEGKKQLARWASGFIFLLANPEFYSHLTSWLVVIRTPETVVPGGNHCYVVRAENPFYTVQHI